MLTLNECRKLLGSKNKKYTDDELKVALEFLQQLAEIAANDVKKERE